MLPGYALFSEGGRRAVRIDAFCVGPNVGVKGAFLAHAKNVDP